MDLMLIVGVGLGLLMILGAGIALVAGAGSTNVEDRLDQFVGSPNYEVDEKEAAEEFERSIDMRERLDRACIGGNRSDKIRARVAQADVKLKAYEYVVLQLLSAAGVGLLALLIFRGSIFLAVVGAAIGLIIPRVTLNVLASRRMRLFDDQLSDTLNLWVNSLQSGYSVLQSMESIATEMPPPIAVEFERVVQEVRLGLSVDQALGNMLRRVPSEDLDFVVTAVNVQREVGGNLAEILNIISFTIRERVRIKREIQTLTAQVRMSAYVVTALPFGLGGILYAINPTYVAQLFAKERPFIWPDVLPCGWLIVGIGLLMTIIGTLIIRKIVEIEV